MQSMFGMASVRYYLAMGTDTEPFNLDATLAAVGHAFYGVTCNILFWAAVHGLAIALTVHDCLPPPVHCLQHHRHSWIDNARYSA
jgi:hypothetical protein